MRQIIVYAALLTILLTGCLREPIHQGNRLDANEIGLIQVGQTKFTIEQTLGSPALHSTLHPNRVTYIESFEDKDSGELHNRGVEITYDDARRATKIRRFGFADQDKK